MIQASALSSSDARGAALGDATLSDQSAPVRHLAVILDGNRRWAQRLSLQSIDGYRAGGRNVHALLSWCSEANIPIVTPWPLSAENLSRDQEELRGLLTVIVEVFEELAGSQRWRLHVIGDLSRLPHGAVRRWASIRSRPRCTCSATGELIASRCCLGPQRLVAVDASREGPLRMAASGAGGDADSRATPLAAGRYRHRGGASASGARVSSGGVNASPSSPRSTKPCRPAWLRCAW